MQLNWYRQRWLKLWKQLGAKGNAEEWFDRIVQEWIRPWRVYHDIEHLGEGLIKFDEMRKYFRNPIMSELVWWLHDVIYDPHKALGENERLSADFALAFLRAVGLYEKYGAQMEKMILSSTPGVEPEDHDSKLLCDLDIIRFAVKPKRFWEISAMVREEYSFASREEYNKNRALVLHMFSNRNHIFRTKVFRDKFETPAQRNIKSALRRLEKPTD